MNKLFKNVSCKGRYSEFFFRRVEGDNGHFFRQSYFEEKSRNKNSFRGYEGMLPRKCFENLGSVLVILVLFVHFVMKIPFKIFTPNFESSTKYDAMARFVYIFRFMLARRKDYFYRKGSKLWKICIHQRHC